jgi:hypothetical protein
LEKWPRKKFKMVLVSKIAKTENFTADKFSVSSNFSSFSSKEKLLQIT